MVSVLPTVTSPPKLTFNVAAPEVVPMPTSRFPLFVQVEPVFATVALPNKLMKPSAFSTVPPLRMLMEPELGKTGLATSNLPSICQREPTPETRATLLSTPTVLSTNPPPVMLSEPFWMSKVPVVRLELVPSTMTTRLACPKPPS